MRSFYITFDLFLWKKKKKIGKRSYFSCFFNSFFKKEKNRKKQAASKKEAGGDAKHVFFFTSPYRRDTNQNSPNIIQNIIIIPIISTHFATFWGILVNYVMHNKSWLIRGKNLSIIQVNVCVLLKNYIPSELIQWELPHLSVRWQKKNSLKHTNQLGKRDQIIQYLR